MNAATLMGLLPVLVPAVGGLWILVQVAILIVVVSRVAWRQRERRFAAVRLVGATRTQIAILAAV